MWQDLLVATLRGGKNGFNSAPRGKYVKSHSFSQDRCRKEGQTIRKWSGTFRKNTSWKHIQQEQQGYRRWGTWGYTEWWGFIPLPIGISIYTPPMWAMATTQWASWGVGSNLSLSPKAPASCHRPYRNGQVMWQSCLCEALSPFPGNCSYHHVCIVLSQHGV